MPRSALPASYGITALLVAFTYGNACITAAAEPAPAVEIFVSSSEGDDSTAAPRIQRSDALTYFRSLGAARDAARVVLQHHGRHVDLSVTLMDGVYAETLALGPADSGTPEHPVVWQAAGCRDSLLRDSLRDSLPRRAAPGGGAQEQGVLISGKPCPAPSAADCCVSACVCVWCVCVCVVCVWCVRVRVCVCVGGGLTAQ